MSSPKVAIITGASSGIGRACAVALSKAGWKVALAARRQQQLEETQALCDGETITVAGDIADEAYVGELFKKTVDAFGRVDLVFNNAGTNAPQIPLEDLPLDTFRKVIDVNLTAAFICTQHAFRQFKSQTPPGGRIINNGSVSAQTPRPHTPAYTASKHALLGLTKSTALDGRNFDITCTQIDIGNCLTDMGAPLGQGTMQPDGSIKKEAMYDVEHVASTIVHIASLPNTVQTLHITLMATKMPLVGRG
ncbi:NAD(P)-binding protein [Exidia glandulosa HHB12029]|uniref:NAD(P)-binding protein n=1 Tax=Exidia glandulosa HHB12029 TaxID=1314781 RepID=A0A165P1V1_EXIGL|nr:NAD(P)-binding protein [Exidia glandulosa HHB12029]